VRGGITGAVSPPGRDHAKEEARRLVSRGSPRDPEGSWPFDGDGDMEREQVIEGGGTTMASGKTDELKGRIKEAAGALTGDKQLKREGKTDQAVGKVKQQAEKVIDKVKDTLKG
jgi:uncharacterized protein YjbJ (UPF0337 family)